MKTEQLVGEFVNDIGDSAKLAKKINDLLLEQFPERPDARNSFVICDGMTRSLALVIHSLGASYDSVIKLLELHLNTAKGNQNENQSARVN